MRRFLFALTLSIMAILCGTKSWANDLGSWSSTTSEPSTWGGWSGQVTQYDGRIYAVGSNYTEGSHTSWMGTTLPSGSIAGWTEVASPNVSRLTGQGVTAANGYIYAVGGMPAPYQYLANVEYAAINADGTLGSWMTTSSLARNSGHAPLVTWGNHLYSVGGAETDMGFPRTVQVAEIQPDGSLGPWGEDDSVMNDSHPYSAAVVDSGYLYVIGGSQHTFLSSTVERAEILSDGSLGQWVVENSLPYAVGRHGAAILNDTIYVLGGVEDAYGATPTPEVLYATINPTNHSLSAWATTTDLPTAAGYGAAVVGDHIYAIHEGGSTNNYYSNAAPEPSSLVLLGIAAASLLGYAWRRRQAA